MAVGGGSAISSLVLLIGVPLGRGPGLEQLGEQAAPPQERVGAPKLLLEARHAAGGHAGPKIPCRLKRILDAQAHFRVLLFVDHHVHHEVLVGGLALPQAHGDRLPFPIDLLGVEPDEARKQRSHGHACLGHLGRRRSPPFLAFLLVALPATSSHRHPIDHLEALQRRQERAPFEAHLQIVHSQQGPSVGGQVALGGVTHPAVLGPPPDQQDEVPRPRVDAVALPDEGGVVQGADAVHREVDGDAVGGAAKRWGSHQSHLRLLPAESRPAELEAARGDELVRADADGGLLQLPGVDVRCGLAALRQAPLQLLEEDLRAGARH
mmetsp:Transcript_44472/g.129317  ORF Transcript_44472/g.129317 Transcript_44472/m.129317 type:complete len:322 (-) Transcript_44472:312-1277(-)